jgi:hypothetical protein
MHSPRFHALARARRDAHETKLYSGSAIRLVQRACLRSHIGIVVRTAFSGLSVFSFLGAVAALAQPIPDVRCVVEHYPVRAVVAWQFPETLSKVQVVVLRDPSGE